MSYKQAWMTMFVSLVTMMIFTYGVIRYCNNKFIKPKPAPKALSAKKKRRRPLHAQVHYASQREFISTGTFCPSADIAVDVLSKGKNQ